MPERDDLNRGTDDPSDLLLDGLIRQSRAGSDESAERPSDASIAAYISGAATAAQRREVRDALESSASFRRDLLEITREYGEMKRQA